MYAELVLDPLEKKKRKKKCSAVHSICLVPMWRNVIIHIIGSISFPVVGRTTSVLATHSIIR